MMSQKLGNMVSQKQLYSSPPVDRHGLPIGGD